MNRQQGSTRGRGRPPHAWLDVDALRTLPAGTAIALEQRGSHNPRAAGRILATDPDLQLVTTGGTELTIAWSKVKRGRTIAALYEPGDPVLKRGVTEQLWRGGVVRTEGTDVLVEQLGGAFVWLPEADLEPPEARDPVAPPAPRGPVPARV